MRQNGLLGRQVAGRFTIKRFLGEGGMATVYLAEQEQEPHEVALKIMNEDLNADLTFVKRFQREAKAAARVQHPNSVHIIAYGFADNMSYIAMELLKGDDLYSLLERDGAIAQGRAVRILIEVCDALMVAHELGIVHRDLKPENIMVCPDKDDPKVERVKVLDFGIAKLLETELANVDPRAEPASQVTRAGTFIGTPAYMSPEQCALQPVDTRADIYTCGVLLFQLVTGRLPFEGQTPLHTATLHIHEPVPRPSIFAPSIDQRLEAVIMKALAKRPTDRHQTARHLASTLRKILPDLPDVPVAKVKPSLGGGRLGGPRSRPARVLADDARAPQSALEDPMESARTMVAHGTVGPPPAVVLHAEGAPDSTDMGIDSAPARIRPAPVELSPDSSDTSPIDSEDSMRTLVRSPSDDEEAPQRFGPKNTEVILAVGAGGPGSVASPQPSYQGQLAMNPTAAQALGPSPAIREGRSSAAPLQQAGEEAGALEADAVRIPEQPVTSAAAFAATAKISATDLAMAETAAGGALQTAPMISAPGASSAAITAPLLPQTAPMIGAPGASSAAITAPLLPQTPPVYPLAAPQPGADQSRGSARGLLIGFLAGALVMALLAIAYLVLRY